MGIGGKTLGWLVNTTAQAIVGAIFLAVLAGGSVTALFAGVGPTATAASAGVLAAVVIFVVVLLIGAIGGRATKGQAPTQALARMRGASGLKRASSIGIFRNITFQYDGSGAQSRLKVCCVVDFLGVEGVPSAASPLELRLTANEGQTELGRLLVPNGTDMRAPTTIAYYGECSWDSLRDLASRTMIPAGENPHKTRPMPWSTTPPGDSLYCTIEFRLPDGLAGKHHEESGACLEFELGGLSCKKALIRIDPWSNLAPPGVTLTPL